MLVRDERACILARSRSIEGARCIGVPELYGVNGKYVSGVYSSRVWCGPTIDFRGLPVFLLLLAVGAVVENCALGGSSPRPSALCPDPSQQRPLASAQRVFLFRSGSGCLYSLWAGCHGGKNAARRRAAAPHARGKVESSALEWEARTRTAIQPACGGDHHHRPRVRACPRHGLEHNWCGAADTTVSPALHCQRSSTAECRTAQRAAMKKTTRPLCKHIHQLPQVSVPSCCQYCSPSHTRSHGSSGAIGESRCARVSLDPCRDLPGFLRSPSRPCTVPHRARHHFEQTV